MQVSTPDKLDIDILVNNKKHIMDRFWNTFFKRTDENQKKQWQTVVTESGWRSDMMVICQKP